LRRRCLVDPDNHRAMQHQREHTQQDHVVDDSTRAWACCAAATTPGVRGKPDRCREVQRRVAGVGTPLGHWRRSGHCPLIDSCNSSNRTRAATRTTVPTLTASPSTVPRKTPRCP
jgi:hypothetical protein